CSYWRAGKPTGGVCAKPPCLVCALLKDFSLRPGDLRRFGGIGNGGIEADEKNFKRPHLESISRPADHGSRPSGGRNRRRPEHDPEKTPAPPPSFSPVGTQPTNATASPGIHRAGTMLPTNSR